MLETPIFHQISYALLNFIIFYYGLTNQLAIFKKKTLFDKQFSALLLNTLFGFVISFFLWNVDTICCESLRQIRLNIHPAFRPFFQLHGYWHIGTAFACYNGILHQQLIRLAYLDRDHDIELAYFGKIVPYVRQRSFSNDRNKCV
ncbi:hypothetical protein BB559_000634 [Furculomyces boomerangus]|uniref:Alkaline ceramidase n=2 Tax=Harpellales TaxID=61421 RepID=A0A2T9Z4M0_9FUNG|nr:hypothetical protein BB559_000634 [Furculomyces boomerangus]PVZ97014.1 hypothetical protein BB558_007063 [Smittium angustum]